MTLPQTQDFVLRFDGACSPNPGPMGIGYTLSVVNSSVGGQGGVGVNDTPSGPAVPGETLLVRVGAQVGEGTNNIAEYHALIAGLRHAIRLGMWNVTILSDSKLVVEQMRGQWKVRDAFLRKLHGEATGLVALLASWMIQHIRREENTVADALSHEQTYEEPSLPPTLVVRGNQRSLHGWQAAFIRHHWTAGIRNSYFLARIFDITPTQVEAIGNATSYKDASFEGLPHYWHDLETGQGVVIPPPADLTHLNISLPVA